MLISDGGTLVRTGTGQISTLGRNTQGVTLIRLSEDEKLVGLARIEPEAEETDEPEEQAGRRQVRTDPHGKKSRGPAAAFFTLDTRSEL